MLLADLVFPVLMWPYITVVLFPITAGSAIASEIFVFWLFNRSIPIFTTIRRVVFANLVSWAVGGLLIALLPENLIPQPINANENSGWAQLAFYGSFSLACVLSIIIEYAAYRFLQLLSRTAEPDFRGRKKNPHLFSRLGECTIYANVVSYAVIIGVIWIGTLLAHEKMPPV